MAEVLIAVCLAYCVFEVARTILYCRRIDQLRRELEQIPTRVEDEDAAYNNMARVMGIAEEARALERSWWMWPHSTWLKRMEAGSGDGRGGA